MDRKTLFVEVILPLPLDGSFTYRVPFEMNEMVAQGMRVLVQFGTRKVYAALVVSVHENIPQNYQPKYILAVLDAYPIVNQYQLKFWTWISKYYISGIGEVMNAALPTAFKLSSESKLVLNPDFEIGSISLNEKEALILTALQNQDNISITQASELTDLKKVFPLIKTMTEKGIVLMEEELEDKYKVRKETRVQLVEEYREEEALRELFSQLEKRAFKQLEVVMAFLHLSQKRGGNHLDLPKKELLSQLENGASAYASLEKKGVFFSFEQSISRLVDFAKAKEVESIELSFAQNEAFEAVKNSFGKQPACLLHGITGSGKTEIYIKLMDEVIKEGKQVLYLLPEIALTAQIINRLRKYFGEKVGVYHSRYNIHERVEIWNKVLNEEEGTPSYQIILSARSGVFLPFKNLGLIIVDEEHDNSYKQFDPAPRYHARDAALVLANQHKAKVVLGSATPSVETYYNARSGKYGLVSLTERFGEGRLPEILVSDVKHETKRKTMNGHFSSFLMMHVKEALERNEQVILFQNRRGFAPRLECEVCNWIPECPNCDISLVYHKNQNRLRCHICGHSSHLMHTCGSCGSKEVRMKGFGTEKLEEDLSIILPEARIKRMDLDTTRAKNAFEKIFEDFADKKIDILVGTQMVTKGLDFENVSVVGVLNADNMINFPDFRAFERSFQMLVQVSGRAGRKEKKGKVIIQSFNPYHSVIRYVIENSYQKMYDSQILERRNYKYPPFYRLIRFTLKHKDYRVLNEAMQDFSSLLREKFGQRIIGPEYPMVARMRNLYLKEVLLKLEKGYPIDSSRKVIHDILDAFNSGKQYKAIRVVIDVDPM
ncbi:MULTISPECIES: primosomal protein N' [unclassified Lentimicrobium]|uniref:replication restart helicase PriA n=1 Tax=unclassified Lentimicrobium TaxID=2677434 RepID=UPI001557FDFF|nr:MULTISPECIES: primosomal protein N' [unclassified Lentimicrobium]NPD45819.1 primosomal protein N' [Lentimicrobium sp. S6]NPD85816.1 primosomal protein N' [Lentimicrobium sp. L6]